MQHVRCPLCHASFWAHHQHRTTLPHRAQCQLLLLPLLICLQHHRLAGNRIRAPAAEQANTNVLLPTIIHVWPQMSLSTLKRLPQGAMTQERVTPNTNQCDADGGKLVPQKRLGVVRVVRVGPGKKGVNSGLFLTS